MLFMPTNVYPSAFGGLGGGTIDAGSDLTVSWQVTGSPALMTAYSITIYCNNSASTQLYTTGKLTNNCPFYGVNYAGETVIFRHTITAAALAAAGITNGGSYKLIIRQWWSDTEYVEQVSASAFIARTAPTVTINNVPEKLTAREHTFTAVYSQAQGDALMWVRWRIAEEGQLDRPVFDTQAIYGTAELKAGYDGFFTGNTYAVRCTVETENGVQADSGWQSFEVEYATQALDGAVEVSQAKESNGLRVRWQKIKYIPSTATGKYETENGVLALPAKSSVEWATVTGEAMRIAAPWTVMWQGRPVGACTVLSIAADSADAELTIAPQGVTLTFGAETLFVGVLDFRPVDRLTVIIRPDSISVQHRGFTGGLYPSKDLFPSGALYPRGDTIPVIKAVLTGNFAAQSWDIRGLTLNGRQECDYLVVISERMSDRDAAQAMAVMDYKPEADWAGSTEFYADFTDASDGLTAGNAQSMGGQVTGFAVYRMASGEGTLTHIGDFPLEVREVIDCGAASQQEYTYIMFAASNSSFPLAPVMSPAVKGRFWSWTLLECEEDAGGFFRVLNEYSFRYNVVSGSISNNNTPNMLENFTPYPLAQLKSANYKSGTLTGLIGQVSGGEYSDTLRQRDALMALSLTEHPLFLKNRKGDVLRVRVSGPVTVETMDNTAEQAQTAAISWTETGSAEGVSILKFPVGA